MQGNQNIDPRNSNIVDFIRDAETARSQDQGECCGFGLDVAISTIFMEFAVSA